MLFPIVKKNDPQAESENSNMTGKNERTSDAGENKTEAVFLEKMIEDIAGEARTADELVETFLADFLEAKPAKKIQKKKRWRKSKKEYLLEQLGEMKTEREMQEKTIKKMEEGSREMTKKCRELEEDVERGREDAREKEGDLKREFEQAQAEGRRERESLIKLNADLQVDLLINKVLWERSQRESEQEREQNGNELEKAREENELLREEQEKWRETEKKREEAEVERERQREQEKEQKRLQEKAREEQLERGFEATLKEKDDAIEGLEREKEIKMNIIKGLQNTLQNKEIEEQKLLEEMGNRQEEAEIEQKKMKEQRDRLEASQQQVDSLRAELGQKSQQNEELAQQVDDLKERQKHYEEQEKKQQIKYFEERANSVQLDQACKELSRNIFNKEKEIEILGQTIEELRRERAEQEPNEDACVESVADSEASLRTADEEEIYAKDDICAQIEQINRQLGNKELHQVVQKLKKRYLKRVGRIEQLNTLRKQPQAEPEPDEPESEPVNELEVSSGQNYCFYNPQIAEVKCLGIKISEKIFKDLEENPRLVSPKSDEFGEIGNETQLANMSFGNNQFLTGEQWKENAPKKMEKNFSFGIMQRQSQQRAEGWPSENKEGEHGLEESQVIAKNNWAELAKHSREDDSKNQIELAQLILSKINQADERKLGGNLGD